MSMAGPARPAYLLYHTLWQAVDWLFPPTCGGCDQLGVRWCVACQNSVTRIVGPVCLVCGEPQASEQVCPECQDITPAYQALRSYGEFTGTLRSAMHRLKYKQDIPLGEALSKHLIELYNQLKWEIDMVMPVPLSQQRMKERGYNQSGLLGRPLAYAMDKPYRPAALQRNRETRSQVGLSANERRINVAGSFSACKKQVDGKAVLLIDDVTTTGSTINACAQALREAGASNVYGMTLAKAVLKTHTDDLPILSLEKRR